MLIIYKQLVAYFMQRVTSEQVLLYTLPGTLIEMYCRWDFAGGKEQGEPLSRTCWLALTPAALILPIYIGQGKSNTWEIEV